MERLGQHSLRAAAAYASARSRVKFQALLAGKTEEEVFGSEAPPSGPPVPGEPAPERPGGSDRAPRPLPRPGLAGGGVEARGLDLPEKPEFAPVVSCVRATRSLIGGSSSDVRANRAPADACSSS